MKAARKQCLLRHKAARDYTRLLGGRLRSLFYQLRGGCAGVALATVLLVTIGLIAGAAGLSVQELVTNMEARYDVTLLNYDGKRLLQSSVGVLPAISPDGLVRARVDLSFDRLGRPRGSAY